MSRCDMKYICAGMASLALFIVVSIGVTGGDMDLFNESVRFHITSLVNPAFTNLMIAVDIVGKWYVYLSIALLLLILPKTRMKIGIPITLAIGGGMFLNYILKQWFAIPRPDEIYRLVSASGYGHPSGHIMYGFAFIGTCVFLFLRSGGKKSHKTSVTVSAAAFMLLMGFNRVYLGVHTATDVIAGYLMGIFIVTMLAVFLQKIRLI